MVHRSRDGRADLARVGTHSATPTRFPPPCVTSPGSEAVVLAVRPERSRLDSLLRYVSLDAATAARWTPSTAHDTSIARLPHTVEAMQDVADLHRITVHTRAGTVFANERGRDGRWQQPALAHEALAAEHDRPFDSHDALIWLDQYRQVIEVADELPTIDQKALPTYLALLEDADRVAVMAAPNSEDPRRPLHADVRRRAAAMLMRHDPSLVPPGRPGPAAGRAFPPHPYRLTRRQQLIVATSDAFVEALGASRPVRALIAVPGAELLDIARINPHCRALVHRKPPTQSPLG
jgi:hypothetical protein